MEKSKAESQCVNSTLGLGIWSWLNGCSNESPASARSFQHVTRSSLVFVQT